VGNHRHGATVCGIALGFSRGTTTNPDQLIVVPSNDDSCTIAAPYYLGPIQCGRARWEHNPRELFQMDDPCSRTPSVTPPGRSDPSSARDCRLSLGGSATLREIGATPFRHVRRAVSRCEGSTKHPTLDGARAYAGAPRCVDRAQRDEDRGDLVAKGRAMDLQHSSTVENPSPSTGRRCSRPLPPIRRLRKTSRA
jgi:hypothetical protein